MVSYWTMELFAASHAIGEALMLKSFLTVY